MLENSYGLTFFLKSPKKKSDFFRYVYLRVTVDGVPKETSIKKKWDCRRWDQKSERAVGTKEDAREFNHFLDVLVTKINNYKLRLIGREETITSERIIGFVKGDTVSKVKVLEEFEKHNQEVFLLLRTEQNPNGEYAKGTLTKFKTTQSHLSEFIRLKYFRKDIEFRELNYEFISDFELFLKTVKKCTNNTTLKYLGNFKKIVLRAIVKEYISNDPFKLFKRKRDNIKKKPLTKAELSILENKVFSTDRLSLVRDIFVFQCYTGLAYIDVRQLKGSQIKEGSDGKLWIMSNRQKTGSATDIPLLPKALEILNKYKDHPLYLERGTVLPVKSNQKMNEYLKEIQTLCGFDLTLTTHRARRTFASTVTLNNGVPIYVVKEMMGHHSIKQTEHYALTEQDSVNREMAKLEERMTVNTKPEEKDLNSEIMEFFENFEKELNELKSKEVIPDENEGIRSKIVELDMKIKKMKERFSMTA